MAKNKLIIHETDPHGCGNIIFNNEVYPYTYDDGDFGDVGATIRALIRIGFINTDDILIIEGNDIYSHLKEMD